MNPNLYLDLDLLKFPINNIHQCQRKAEAYLSVKKFTEAIFYHKKAIELLDKLLTTTNSAKSNESFKKQKDYHERQVALVLFKQSCYEESKKAKEEKIKSEMDNDMNKDSVRSQFSLKVDGLQVDIAKTINQNEVLLNNLHSNIDPEDSLIQYKEDNSPNSNVLGNDAIPHKDIIEELQINNLDLRRLFDNLVQELESSNKEKEQLQGAVKDLQHKLASTSRSSMLENTYNMNTTSIPSLPPLEVPKFDFNQWGVKT